MMQWKNILAALSCLRGLHLGSAQPVNSGSEAKTHAEIPAEPSALNEDQQKNKKEYDDYFGKQLSGLTIIKTTKHADGQVIDWIPIESQGTIAKAPPSSSSPPSDPNRPTLRPLVMLEVEGAEKGPAGTVPIPRQNMELVDLNRSLQDRLNKTTPIGQTNPAADAAQPHWYASSAQAVNNHGGSATFSLFKPFVQSAGDFSLLQTAVIKYNVPVGNMQTVEAGWINFPSQVQAPHLFTYFTTVGYASQGNNVGGWNRDQNGWVQVDTSIFPGTALSPNSVIGASQYEFNLRYQLFEGNWWLEVLGKWIGYYPASMFSANNSDASKTLAQGSSQINFYGEIYQGESSITTTDMGSGEFPSTGFGKSAYIRSIVYTDTTGKDQQYDGSSQQVVSDTSRYNIASHYKSGTSWGSYAYLGGPGASGVTGG